MAKIELATENTDALDYSKLLGFQAIREKPANCLDFKHEMISAKLGAKIGGIETTAPGRKLP